MADKWLRRAFFDYEADPEAERITPWLARPGLRIERIASYGQASDWYEQDEDEWVLLIEGEARLALEREGRVEELALAAGDSLLLPAGLRHRVLATSRPALWLCVFVPACRSDSGPLS